MNSGVVNLAIIGVGNMGLLHLRKVKELEKKLKCRVTAIIEPDESRVRYLKRELPKKRDFKFLNHLGELDSLSEEDKVHAAILAVPAKMNVQMTAACLKKKIHCLVEKPLGFSAMDCRDLERKATKNNCFLQVGMLERWAMCRLWGDWRPKLSEGPWSLSCVRKGPYLPRVADTDVIHDLMIHDIDLFVLLKTVFDLPKIKKIRAWGRKMRSETLDHAVADFEFEDLSRMRFYSSRLSTTSSRNWELTGPGWHATLDYLNREFLCFEEVKAGRKNFRARRKSWKNGDPLGLEIEAFVQRIRGKFNQSTSAHNIFKRFGDDPMKMLPSADTVIDTHKIIDRILSQIKVL